MNRRRLLVTLAALPAALALRRVYAAEPGIGEEFPPLHKTAEEWRTLLTPAAYAVLFGSH